MDLPELSEPVTQPANSVTAPSLARMRRMGRTGLVARLYANAEMRRVVAFLIAGGVSALVTMAVTQIMLRADGGRFLLAALIGTEVGILISFALNDRFAFSDLDGHDRPIAARLLRFHLTCAFGQSLILAFSTALFDLAHWPSLAAQAIPIAVVTFVNFAVHRFWTYRRIAG